jgi:radical SAM-linked protein
MTVAPNYIRMRIVFSVLGRIRFLSHLETQETILGALRRAGIKLAFSQGMKPKPVIKLALPRPVAVESWAEIVEVRVQEEFDPDAMAMSLLNVLPDGLIVVSVERIPDGQPDAAARVAGATYRALLSNDVDRAALRSGVDAFNGSDDISVERNTPKQRRTVDVKSYVPDVALVESDSGVAIRWHAELRQDGSVKPQELITAVQNCSGTIIPVRKIVRESIAIAQPGGGVRDAAPALVGADVPDGPEKPWGAC